MVMSSMQVEEVKVMYVVVEGIVLKLVGVRERQESLYMYRGFSCVLFFFSLNFKVCYVVGVLRCDDGILWWLRIEQICFVVVLVWVNLSFFGVISVVLWEVGVRCN